MKITVSNAEVLKEKVSMNVVIPAGWSGITTHLCLVLRYHNVNYRYSGILYHEVVCSGPS